MRPCFGQRCCCDSRDARSPSEIGLAWWALFETRQAERWVVLVLLAAQFATSLQVAEFWFQVQFKAAALVPWRTGVAVLAALLKMAVAVATHDPIAVACVFAIEYLLAGGASLLALRRASGAWLQAGPVVGMGPLVRRQVAVAACIGYRGGDLPAHRHRAPRTPAGRRGGRHLRSRGPVVRGLVHGAGGADGGRVSGTLEPSLRRSGLPAQPAGLARCAVRGGACACGPTAVCRHGHWSSCCSARHFRHRRPCCRSTSGRAYSSSCVRC